MAEETQKPATEATEGGAEAQAAAPAGNKKKLLMIGSAAVAVLGIIVAVGVVFFMGGEKEEAHDAKATAVPELAVYDVPEFTLNLLQPEGSGGARYLKIRLALELENAADAPTMEKLLPRLQDDWGSYLRQLRSSDLQGSASMQRLKEGLLRRAQQSLEPVPVKTVFVRDMLVQ